MPMASSRAWKPAVEQLELELVLLNHVSESDIPIVSRLELSTKKQWCSLVPTIFDDAD